MTDDDITQVVCKQTLSQKYGITDEQLEFKYVKECKNPIVVERILKVLRSNEVGHFKELEEFTERRLRELAPNSRPLVTPQPVLSWNELNAEQRSELDRDFLSPDGRANDQVPAYQELRREAEEMPREFPAIRNAKKTTFSFKDTPVKNERSPKSCAPRSFDSWNDFDVEKEHELIDRQEELNLNAAIRAKNEEKSLQMKSDGVSGLKETGAGDAHLQSAALQERLKGNEFYQAKDYQKAIDYYTKSISLSPNAESFNNRAQCYINLSKHEDAIMDCRKALHLSPYDSNVVSKAYYRLSTAYSEMGRHQEAYEEIQNALKVDSNDKFIQTRASTLLEKIRGSHFTNKKVRIAIQDKESGRSNPIIEEDIYYPFMNSSDNLAQSDIGTARLMCRCNGVPPFIAKLRLAENLPKSNRLCLRKTRPKIPLNEKKSQFRVEKGSGFVNGEIIEKDKIEDVEKVVVNEEMRKILTLKSNLISSLERGDLESVVQEVASMHPSHVREALSGRLDASTLNLCLKALCVHLKNPSAWKNVEEHLLALAQLPLFRLSLKHLEKATKDALSERIALVEEEGQRVSHVVTLYELNGALPPPV